MNVSWFECTVIFALALGVHFGTDIWKGELTTHAENVVNHSCTTVNDNFNHSRALVTFCEEPYGWKQHTLNTTATIDANQKNGSNPIPIFTILKCGGHRSCFDSITNNISFVFCEGFQSCALSYIEPKHSIFCDGSLSCSKSIIATNYVALIHGRGAYSLSHSVIYINYNHEIYGNTTRIILDGYKSGANLTIVVSDQRNHLSITCKHQACFDTKIICIDCKSDGNYVSNIKTECTNANVSFCPVIRLIKNNYEFVNINQFNQQQMIKNAFKNLNVDGHGKTQFQIIDYTYYSIYHNLWESAEKRCGAEFKYHRNTADNSTSQANSDTNSKCIDLGQFDSTIGMDDIGIVDTYDLPDLEVDFAKESKLLSRKLLTNMIMLKASSKLSQSEIDGIVDRIIDHDSSRVFRSLAPNYNDVTDNYTDLQTYNSKCQRGNIRDIAFYFIGAVNDHNTHVVQQPATQPTVVSMSTLLFPNTTTIWADYYESMNYQVLQLLLQANEEFEIFCTGTKSCSSVIFANPNARQSTYCLGAESCSTTYEMYGAGMIDFEAIYCSGYKSCQSINIKNSHNVHFMQNRNTDVQFAAYIAKLAEWLNTRELVSLIHNHQEYTIVNVSNSYFESTNVFFKTVGAGYYVQIVCSEGEKCDIYCEVPGACNFYFTLVRCAGECNIYCTTTKQTPDTEFITVDKKYTNYVKDCPFYYDKTGIFATGKNIQLIKQYVVIDENKSFNATILTNDCYYSSNIDTSYFYSYYHGCSKVLLWLTIPIVILLILYALFKNTCKWKTRCIRLYKQLSIHVQKADHNTKRRIDNITQILFEYDARSLDEKVAFVKGKKKYCNNHKCHKKKYFLNQEFQVCRRKLWRCRACMQITYCSRKCQKCDWPSHQNDCHISN